MSEKASYSETTKGININIDKMNFTVFNHYPKFLESDKAIMQKQLEKELFMVFKKYSK